MEEDNEAAMARSLHGLNYDISYKVKLYHYVEVDHLMP